jgi:hypothetical protein
LKTYSSPARLGWAALAAIAATFVVAVPQATLAKEVSPAVKRACANDYFAHCSMHPVGTPAVRKCMRAVGPRLSKPCIGALVSAGEVSPADRKRYKATKSARRN